MFPVHNEVLKIHYFWFISKPNNNDAFSDLLPPITIFVKSILIVGKNSFIYANISIYRFVMSLLYGGNYYRRFSAVSRHIEGKKVTELCFGDTVIADFCRKHHIGWKGYDINPHFIKRAARKGFDVQPGNIKAMRSFAAADVCIMAGSLYHFHDETDALFEKMLACAPKIILSEPVINLSGRNGIIGKLAKASANVNGAGQSFRYTEKTLVAELERLQKKMNFTFSAAEQIDKDLVIIINR